MESVMNSSLKVSSIRKSHESAFAETPAIAETLTQIRYAAIDFLALNEVNEVKTEGVTEEGDEVPESGAAFSFEQGGREWVFAASSEGEMKEWARKIIGS